MVRRWGRLVGVTPLLLGMMVAVPQMVEAHLPAWGQSQENQLDDLLSQGTTQYQRGQRTAALATFQQALALARQTRDRRREAVTLSNIGLVYDSVGQPQRALEYYQQALPIRREVNDRSGEATTLNNIGLVYNNIGQPQRALEYYQQALPIRREVNDRSGEAATLNNIGEVYRRIGQPQRALEYYQQALPISREVNDHSGEATTLNNIGLVYGNIGQLQQALAYYQQALLIRREVNDRSGEATTLNNIGLVYNNIGQPQRALEYYQQALPIMREVNDRRGESITLNSLALVQKTLNDLTSALQNIQAAIAIVEEIRGNLIDPELRTAYFASVHDYYGFQIELLMQLHQQNPSQGYNIQAFNLTERNKARTLLELLAESRTDIRNGVDPQLLQQERDIQAQIDAIDQRRIELANSRTNNSQALEDIETQRATLQTQYRDLQTQIRATSPKYAALKYPQPLTLEQIQQQVLDDNTVILTYSLGKDQSYLWLVSKTEISSYQLPAGKTIEDLVNKKARPQLTNARTSRASLIAETTDLSNILLKPVLDQIGNKRLVIISDGALQLIPVGALPDPRAENGQYQPLLVNNEVDYLPSASILQSIRNATQNRPPAPRTLAVFADPVFSADDPRVNRGAATTNTNQLPATTSDTRSPWNRIPGTRREAEAILNLVSPDSRLGLFDFQANRENALSGQLSQYRIIHWAAESFVNPQKPELSSVVMSLVDENGQPQNGFLLLRDIFNLNLNADLVVLSGCKTGLGAVVPGEGVIGLPRGLMSAGSPRVISSLWTISDEKTITLMSNFYEKMLQQQLSPAAALRAAQLELFRSRGNWVPFYWAAFTLQGEWR